MRIPYLLLIIAGLCTAVIATADAMGPGIEGCSSNCASCHTITPKEARDLIAPAVPGSEIVEVKASPVRGLFQALVRKGKDEAIIYIDYAKKYLITAQIFDTGRKTDITREELDNSKRIDLSRIRLDNALVMGSPDAGKKLHVFTDPDCPYCAQLHQELKQLVIDDPDVQINIILFPLAIHPAAAGKIDSIVCRSKTSMTGALTLLDRSFERQEIERVECGHAYAADGGKQADALGINVTPTIVLPDGRLIVGMKKAGELRKLVGGEVASAAVGR